MLPRKKQSDLDEFTFNRPHARMKKKPVEHDEDDNTAHTSVQNDIQRFPTYRKIKVSTQTKTKFALDLNRGCKDILSPVLHTNYSREIAKYLGQVVYGKHELVKAFARYWQDNNSEKLANGIKSEGVLLNRSLTISSAQSYSNNLQYRRISSHTTNNDSIVSSVKDVGAGRFGKVYLAVDIVNHLKNKHVEFAEKIVSLQKFSENELNILSSIEHKHIIHLFGAIKSMEAVHIFMNYAPGGNIDELILSNGFVNNNFPLYKEFWATNYFKQVMSALLYLHSNRIVHCDVKAKNIVLSSDFRHCFLADFGEALRIPETSLFIQLESYVGTEPYMCPEMIRKSVFYPKSDVWSCACFLLNMLTFHHPWHSLYPDSSSFMYTIGKKPLEILKEVPQDIQEETKQIFDQSFALLHDRKSSSELLLLAEKCLLHLNSKMHSNNLSEDAETVISFEATTDEHFSQSQNSSYEGTVNVRQASGDVLTTPSPTKQVQIDIACNIEDDETNLILDLLMENDHEDLIQDPNQVKSELEAILSDPDRFLSLTDSCSEHYNDLEMITTKNIVFEKEPVPIKRYPSEKIVHRNESLISELDDYGDIGFSDSDLYSAQDILVHLICAGMDTIDFYSKSDSLGRILLDAENIVLSNWNIRKYCVASNNIWQDCNAAMDGHNEINIYVSIYNQHSNVGWHISDGELIFDVKRSR